MHSPQDPPPTDGETKEDLLREAERLLTAGRSGTAAEAGPSRSFLLFSLGPEWYAVDLCHVRKVIRAAPLARVSGAAPEVLGLMNCHGDVLCVLDLRKILKAGSEGESPATGDRLVVVLHFGGKEAGFVVDSVHDVWELSAASLQPALSSLEPSRARLFEGTAAREGRFVGLLNVSMCLNP